MPQRQRQGSAPDKTKVRLGIPTKIPRTKKGKKRPAPTRPARVTFSALTEDLKGHIYDVGTGSQADQFTATTKELASYFGRKCSDNQDIWITIERQKYVLISIPTSRTDIDGGVAKLLLVKEIVAYANHSHQYRQNNAKIYSVALGQCMEAMNNHLEGEETYKDINGESGVVCLLLLINIIAYSYESKSYPVLAIHILLRKFYTSYQSISPS